MLNLLLHNTNAQLPDRTVTVIVVLITITKREMIMLELVDVSLIVT